MTQPKKHYNRTTDINTFFLYYYYIVSQKNDTDVTHYRFNPHQPISVIFGRDVAESKSTSELWELVEQDFLQIGCPSGLSRN